MSTSTQRMRRLRERRAAGLLPPAGEPVVRDADELLGPSIEESLAALGLDGAGAGAAQLARSYGRVLDTAADAAGAARWIGPELLRALAALGATPMARAKQASRR
jgi:hypothetical protein